MTNRHETYSAQINRVTTYISVHITETLRLDDLAQIAGFSPYHFHRIFKNSTGENLNDFVVRRRLERAVALMKANRSAQLTHIAVESGFSELSVFSRLFKQHYEFAPSQWDRITPLQLSKIRQAPSSLPLYTPAELEQMKDAEAFEVRLRDLAEQTIAYIRIVNAYANPQQIMQAFLDLTSWAKVHAPGGTLIGMSEDDPDVTPPEQCRYDVCMTVPAATKVPAHLSVRTLPACRIAAIHCVGDIALVDRAWQYLYQHWLPYSSFLPDNIPAMEIYVRAPEEIGWETFDIDCAIAIVPNEGIS